MRIVLPLLAVSLATGSVAQAREEGHIAFVTCPIVQDTPTVPCWLAEYGGVTYYMGIQSDVSAPFNPPSLGHKVLVEGTVTDRQVCNATVIEPIRISIMPELSPECEEMRPVREGIDLGFEPPRPPGPSKGRLAFDYPAPPPPPKPPFEPKTYVVPYDFEGVVGFRTPRVLTPALDYAQLSHAGTIEVKGFRGATRLSDGTLLVEHKGIAHERAEEIAEMFRGAGLEKVKFVVSADEDAAEGSPDNRRVEIRIVPSG